jgi:hypothetical protein
VFKELFSGKGPRTSKQDEGMFEYEHLAKLSLSEVLELYEKGSRTGESLTPAATAAACRRLLDIAYCDEGVNARDRALAAQIEERIWTVFEEGLSSNPELLKTARDARNTQLQHAKSFGFGSLGAKISGLDPCARFSEIVKLENASLLPEFPRAAVDNARGQVLRELIRDRSKRQSERDRTLGAHAEWPWQSVNVILVAAWLVFTDDPTIRWLCTKEEMRSFGKGLEQYDSARDVLCALGTLQALPRERPQSAPDEGVVRLGIKRSSSKGTLPVGKLDGESYLSNVLDLSEDGRSAIMLSVFCLRVMIWKTMLQGWFGRQYSEGVFTGSGNSEWLEATRGVRSRIECVYEYSLADNGKRDMAKNLVAEFVLDHVESLNEERQYVVMRVCQELYKAELFHFPQYVLTMIHSLTIPDKMMAALGPDAIQS